MLASGTPLLNGIIGVNQLMLETPLDNGEAVKFEPMEPKLKAPGIRRLKLKHDLLSIFAFNFNLRRYTTSSRS
jgi:hypothetical protein